MYERVREVFHKLKPKEISCIGIAMSDNNPIIVHRFDKCNNDIDCKSHITEIVEGLEEVFSFNYVRIHSKDYEKIILEDITYSVKANYSRSVLLTSIASLYRY
jgi:hypothetical protein